MLIVSTIAILFRAVNIVDNKTKVTLKLLFNDIVVLLFINYVIALFHIISFQDVSWSTYNIIPFKEILRYEIGSNLFFKNIVGNMIMFIPFGLAVPVILKTYKVKYMMFLAFTTSLTIEVTQLIIGRVFDIDDIFLNVVGALIGLFIFRIINFIFKIVKGEVHEQNRNI